MSDPAPQSAGMGPLESIFIVCADLERSQNFYRALGFSQIECKGRSRVFDLGRGLRLHLHEPLTAEESSLYGASWSRGSSAVVLSFLHDDLERLNSLLANEAVLCPPTSTPWGTRLLMVEDPDGHLLEIREKEPSPPGAES